MLGLAGTRWGLASVGCRPAGVPGMKYLSCDEAEGGVVWCAGVVSAWILMNDKPRLEE